MAVHGASAGSTDAVDKASFINATDATRCAFQAKNPKARVLVLMPLPSEGVDTEVRVV